MIKLTGQIFLTMSMLAGLTPATASDYRGSDSDIHSSSDGAYQGFTTVTRTTTHLYDFPGSAPVIETSHSITNNCLASYGGESGPEDSGPSSGGGNIGRGYDVNNDGRGDFKTSREARDAGYDNASRVDNCGNCGNMDRR